MNNSKLPDSTAGYRTTPSHLSAEQPQRKEKISQDSRLKTIFPEIFNSTTPAQQNREKSRIWQILNKDKYPKINAFLVKLNLFQEKSISEPSQQHIAEIKKAIDHQLEKLLQQGNMDKDFTSLKGLLKGENRNEIEQIRQKVIQQVFEQIEPTKHYLDSSDPSFDLVQIKELIYNRLEEISHGKFKISQQELARLRGKRISEEIVTELSGMDTKLFKLQIPPLTIEAKDLAQETLDLEYKKNNKILNQWRKVANPSSQLKTQIADLEKKLQIIEKVLDSRTTGKSLDIDTRIAIIHLAPVDVRSLDRAYIKVLKEKSLDIYNQIKVETDPTKKVALIKEFFRIKKITHVAKTHAEIKKAHLDEVLNQISKMDADYIDIKQLTKASSQIQQPALNLMWEKALNAAATKCFEGKQSRALNSEEKEALAYAQNRLFSILRALENLTGTDKTGPLAQVLSDYKKSPSYLSQETLHHLKVVPKVIEQHQVLSSEESQNLLLLTKFLKKVSFTNAEKIAQLPQEQKEQLHQFLISILGNKTFNAKIQTLSKGALPFGISEEAALFALNLSYKTNHHLRFSRLSRKIEHLVDKLENGQVSSLKDHEKLSIEEYGLLNNLAKLNPLLNKISNYDIFPEKSYFKLLAEKSQITKEALSRMEELFQKSIDQSNTYRSGDISAWHSKGWLQYLNKERNQEISLMSKLITNIGHASYIYRASPDETGLSKVKQSHIFGRYENEEFTLPHAFFSEVFRLDVKSLLNTQSPLYLLAQEMYEKEGKNVEMEISLLYEETAREVHQNRQQNFDHLENDKRRRFDAGKADYGLKGGHTRLKPRNDHFQKVHQKFMHGAKANDGKVKIICSEFVTKAVITSLIETEQQLQKKLQAYIEQKFNVSAKDANEYIRTFANEQLNLIELPYNNTERLKRVHPGRMVELLAKRKALVKVDPPEIVANVFSKKSF